MFQIDDIRQREELWDLYTRKEEYSPLQVDYHGRFMSTYSINRNNVLEPTVSRHLIENGHTMEYPDCKQFAVCLTHDVDEIYPPLKHTSLSTLTCLRRLDLNGIREQALWKFHGKEKSPYWNFREIMELEGEYGARSTFYFLATDRDIRRFRYNIWDLEGELGQIVDQGWEVGLHGGYYAYNSPEEMSQEKGQLERVLGKQVTGYRNHYLRFKVPDSWEFVSKAGFQYDTTLGYPDMVGFRNGMCHPFRPYNLYNDTEVNILEIPLMIMDSVLFDTFKNYDESWRVAKMLIDVVASCNGVLTINWHTSNLNCPFRSSWSRLYEMILKYCHGRDAWMVGGDDIRKWWCQHGCRNDSK